mgnify:CR=1 FL=1|jgi:hypothetical protein
MKWRNKMRRSASEIIRNLESRIARLERQSGRGSNRLERQARPNEKIENETSKTILTKKQWAGIAKTHAPKPFENPLGDQEVYYDYRRGGIIVDDRDEHGDDGEIFLIKEIKGGGAEGAFQVYQEVYPDARLGQNGWNFDDMKYLGKTLDQRARRG